MLAGGDIFNLIAIVGKILPQIFLAVLKIFIFEIPIAVAIDIRNQNAHCAHLYILEARDFSVPFEVPRTKVRVDRIG